MRINEQQIADIRRIIVEQLPDVLMIELFGSRTHDTRRGGDVDLYIEIPRPIPILLQADLLRRLEQALGLPVDLIIHDPHTPPHPIATIACETGIPL